MNIVFYVLLQDNTFQAILVTNGTKSYSIFTYKCGEIEWSGPVSVGYNAPPNTYYNHPLTLTSLPINALACSHLESEWNNVITDLQPGNVILPSPPQPPLFGRVLSCFTVYKIKSHCSGRFWKL